MPNSPYLDKSVHWRIRTGAIDFQEPGYRGTVQAVLSSGLATEVVGLISAGKEADVYLTEYHGAPLAVKVYRLYRTSHRGGRPIKVDSLSWLAAFEYEVMHRAWKAGVRVPTPARRVENMLSMRYLGGPDGPAPRLKDVRLDNPQAFLKDLLASIEAMTLAGVVHGDLSAYNILVHEGEGWFIDFPDAVRVDRLGSQRWQRLQLASEALARGLAALAGYFRGYALTIDVESAVSSIMEKLVARGPLKPLS